MRYAPRLPAVLALLAHSRLTHSCSYDQASGTPCAVAPVAATAGDADEAPGGVVNLGGADLPTVYAVLSDWGGTNVTPYTTPGQLAAAGGMASVCSALSCKAVLSAGGNFLPHGLPGPAQAPASQLRVEATWRGVYSAASLAVPWYATGGAPDWEGNITAERALSVPSTASGALSWHFPQLWSSVELVVPPGYSTLQVLFVDTVTLLGELQPTPARRLRDFNTVADPPGLSALQWAWLTSMLNASTADWLLVVGNDPLYSAGAAGPAPGLARLLVPLLSAANVSLYIGGRDPVAQHFGPTAAAPLLDVIVVGNGASGNATQGTTLPNLAANPATLKFAYGNSAGFATLAFQLPQAASTQAQLEVTFYNSLGTALYSFTKNATRAGQQRPPAAKGAHGSRSGLLLLVLLVMLVAAGIVYVYAMPPPSNAPEPVKRKGVIREAVPLLQSQGPRFNTFSL